MKTAEPIIKIRGNVFVVRGQRVVPAADAAVFYGVSPGVLMRAVARNRQRFTKELVFYLTREEMAALPVSGGKAKKKLPVFTESGVAMLSTVLRSPKAVRTHIEIIRQTVRLLKTECR